MKIRPIIALAAFLTGCTMPYEPVAPEDRPSVAAEQPQEREPGMPQKPGPVGRDRRPDKNNHRE